MAREWTNPNYAEPIQSYLAEGKTFFPIHTASAGANCGNCGGTGRIMYMDPNTNRIKDIPCQACQGSGQTSL